MLRSVAVVAVASAWAPSRTWLPNLRRRGVAACAVRSDSKEAAVEIWRRRRETARFVSELKVALEEEVVEYQEEAKSTDATREAIATTAVVVALTAVCLRLGGRAMLLGMVGLGGPGDEELSRQVSEVLAAIDAVPEGVALAGYVALWTLGKCLCLDFLVLVLAFSSGVVFGGVVQGAAASALCGTLGSSVAFYLARQSDLRPKILRLTRRDTNLAALERAVCSRGFQTVLVLRLAPIVPIPIGAYSYVYGATDMAFWPFALATFLGSLKPYAFDAYIGLVGRDLVEARDDIQEPAIILAFVFFVFIGSLASQLATQTWDDIVKANAQGPTKTDEEDDEDWADVLGLRPTLPWRVGRGVSNALKRREPDWSRRLRHRADRAAFAIASLTREELVIARNQTEDQRNEKPESIVVDRLPPGADRHFCLDGYLVESLVFPYVLLGTLFNDAFLDDQIQAYANRQQGTGVATAD